MFTNFILRSWPTVQNSVRCTPRWQTMSLVTMRDSSLALYCSIKIGQHFSHIDAIVFISPLRISSIKLGWYPPNEHFIYTFFRSFLGLGCTLQFYGDFGGSELVRTAFYSDVHLLGDSHVQRVPWYCRFRFYRDRVLWKTAIFPRREFQCYSGWSCYHQKNHTSPYHTIPYPIPIPIPSKPKLYNWESL